jgi:hypothetical protein
MDIVAERGPRSGFESNERRASLVHICRLLLRKSALAQRTFAERKASAPLKAVDLLGESPSQGNVTALYPTVVTAFARAKVESNLRRNSSP